MPLVQGLLLQVNVERPANQFRLREEAGAPWKAGKGSEVMDVVSKQGRTTLVTVFKRVLDHLGISYQRATMKVTKTIEQQQKLER